MSATSASVTGGFGVRGLDHVGIVVSDLDRTSAWLASALRARVGPPFAPPGRTDVRVASAAIDGGTLQLIELGASKGRPFTLANHDAGAFHVCLRTADIDAAYELLSEQGARFSTPPEVSHAGPAIAYFRDPDGVQFQLIELAGGPLARDPAPGPVERTLGTLHHVGLTLPGLDGATAWFENMLGLTTTLTTQASGELPSRMLESPGASYRAAMVDAGDRWLEIMEFESPPGRGAPPADHEVGAMHLCFEVDDVDAATGILRERGALITAEPAPASGGPQPGAARLASLSGPAGLRIQLVGPGVDG